MSPKDHRIKRLLEIVNEQAEDPGLWFSAETAVEEYIQRALRRLHAAIESEDWAIEFFAEDPH